MKIRPALILIVVAAACWVVTANRMAGMDMGPATELGGIGWFAGVWVTMMAAMMLPSLVPMAQAAGGSRRSTASAVAFSAGYLLAWLAAGLCAYALIEGVRGLDLGFLAWNAGGRYLAGAVIAVAALYELTPVKDAFLRRCRDVGSVERARAGRLAALQIGAQQGGFCIGCCWALMAVLFAVGVMSISWMVVIAAVIAAEKLLPSVPVTVRTTAALLVILGLAVALAPGSVPAFTIPG
jgi:predicted metal-binding membrane protein